MRRSATLIGVDLLALCRGSALLLAAPRWHPISNGRSRARSACSSRPPPSPSTRTPSRQVRGDPNSPMPHGHRLAHRAPAQRSGLQGQVDAREVLGDPRPEFRAVAARLGGADAGERLLREPRQRAALSGRSASGNIRGDAPRKTTSCPRRTPSTSGCRRSASAEAGTGECVWTWRRARPAARPRPASSPAPTKLTIPRVPFASDKDASGADVSVRLPDGRDLSETVIVDDLLVVALGDSFASGDSNPDRPVSFSGSREMLYDPMMHREELANRKTKQTYTVANDDSIDPKVLPRRRLEDEERSQMLRGSSSEFLRGVRAARRALVQSRLPPFAIRLSVPRRDADRAREPAPRGDAGFARLLGRGSRRRDVPRNERARGRSPRRCARSSIS